MDNGIISKRANSCVPKHLLGESSATKKARSSATKNRQKKSEMLSPTRYGALKAKIVYQPKYFGAKDSQKLFSSLAWEKDNL